MPIDFLFDAEWPMHPRSHQSPGMSIDVCAHAVRDAQDFDTAITA
nr:hypothetical protein [Paraburkholderia piptadeniae]